MKTMEDMARLTAGIWNHYMAACQKHPKFADVPCHTNDDYEVDAANEKCVLKQMVASGRGDIPADLVLDAELNEIYAAYCDGDYVQARHEVLDAIAVLLRLDDMLREMQDPQPRLPFADVEGK